MTEQQPNERLLPCPWCHRDDCLELGERLGWQIIYCDYCGACGPYPVGKLTPEEAWNTRVPAVQDGMVAKVLLDAWDHIYGDSVGWGAFKTAVDEGRYVEAIQAMSLYAETTSSESSS